MAAEGDIAVSGSSANFAPTFLGHLFAGAGRVDLAGSGNRYLCGIVADRVEISGSGAQVTAVDCARPERTVAPPVLVPTLATTMASPPDALPGDTLTHTATVTNDGATLLVAGWWAWRTLVRCR